MHVYALHDGPDQTLSQDELLYRNDSGDGDSRVIASLQRWTSRGCSMALNPGEFGSPAATIGYRSGRQKVRSVTSA